MTLEPKNSRYTKRQYLLFSIKKYLLKNKKQAEKDNLIKPQRLKIEKKPTNIDNSKGVNSNLNSHLIDSNKFFTLVVKFLKDIEQKKGEKEEEGGREKV